MRKISWLVKTVLILFFAVCLSSQLSSEEMSKDELMREFGKSQGEPINSGFVFYDGQYIDTPYIVSRQGLEVFINDVMVKKWMHHWPPPDYTVKEDPGPPKGFSENSSLNDIRKSDHIDKKFHYLHQHFPEDVAMQKMAEYYRQIPSVESVTPEQPGDFADLIIKMKSGDVEVHDVRNYVSDYDNLTKQDVLNKVEGYKRQFEERLEKDDCYFFFTKGSEISFVKTKVYEDLKVVIEILRSKRSEDEKINLLERLSFFPQKDVETVRLLVTNFQASNQLERRINSIVNRSGINPRTFNEIPLIPPAITNSLSRTKSAKKHMKNSLEKETDPERRERLQKNLQYLEEQEKELEKKVEFYKKAK